MLKGLKLGIKGFGAAMNLAGKALGGMGIPGFGGKGATVGGKVGGKVSSKKSVVGKGLANIGKGLGRGIGGILRGIAGGLTAFANPAILLG